MVHVSETWLSYARPIFILDVLFFFFLSFFFQFLTIPPIRDHLIPFFILFTLLIHVYLFLFLLLVLLPLHPSPFSPRFTLTTLPFSFDLLFLLFPFEFKCSRKKSSLFTVALNLKFKGSCFATALMALLVTWQPKSLKGFVRESFVNCPFQNVVKEFCQGERGCDPNFGNHCRWQRASWLHSTLPWQT